MKKILISLCLLFLPLSVLASTNTFERTLDDLRVNDYVEVNSSNKSIILRTPSVDASEKVYDFADLFSDEEEQELYDKLTSFIEKYNMDFAVVTINDNNKSSAMNYADDFYDYNDFGVNDTNDGLLFLIDMDTRNYYVSTTGESIRMYNDSRIDGLLDYAESDMRSGNYFSAASKIISRASTYADSGIPSGNENSYIGEKGQIKYIKKINYLSAAILSFIISIIVIIILIAKNRMIKKALSADTYISKALKITEKSDKFLTTHTSVVTINTSSGSGGHSGGSSTHFGSSGISHGGGGRGF